jgi:hypothetical protein
MTRLLARYVVALLVLASCLVITDAMAPTPASAVACTNDSNWNNGLSDTSKRCISGFEYATRRRIPSVCLNQPVVQGNVYEKDACDNGVEAIGQARAVKYLSDRLETPSQGLISPNVQWEMTLPNRTRPDIVVYNRFSAPTTGVYSVSGVHVIEAKVTDNAKYSDWPTQLQRQIDGLSPQATGVREGTILNELSPGGYRDVFKVWDDTKGKCTAAGGNAGWGLRTYVATQPFDGLLSIDEDDSKLECSESKPNNDGPDTAMSIDASGNVDVPAPLPSARQWPAVPSGVACGLLAPSVARTAPVRVTAGSLVAEGAGSVVVEAAEIAALRTGAGLVAALGGPVGATIVGATVAIAVVQLATECGGGVFGDPHLSTVDGLAYDLQSVGEFTLADSGRYGVHVQARLAPSPTPDISYLSRIAVGLGDSRVEFTGSTMYVDGVATALANGHAKAFGDRQFVLRDNAGAYQVLFDGLDGAFLTWRSGRLGFYVPPAADSDFVGLLGNADGNATNDLRLADGTPLPANAAPATLHGDFADSWRIPDAESLFSYGTGESTATFTDMTFPHNIRTVNSLTADQVRIASAQCEAAGVPAGPTFSACVLDLALTADTSFATQAAEQRDVSVDPNALGLDATGRLRADFEASSLPSNVRPARVSTDVATTSFAGGFSGTDAYRLYVQSLSSHTGGTLSFDLLALGDWTVGTGIKTVTVKTDRATTYTVTPSSLTPTRTGTLTSGVAYKVYRIVAPFTHLAEQAEFTVSATNVTGLGGQAFGVDNVDLQATLVAAQHFTGSLPLTVSAGVPGAGAGNIETAVSVDDYAVTLPAAGGLFVDVTSCTNNNLAWSLQNGTGKQVQAGYNCWDGEVRDLPAGSYKLVVRGQSSTAAGAYALTLKTIAADPVYPATVNGAALTATTTTAGQNAAVTFPGAAGQRMTVQLTGGTYTSAGAYLYTPNGVQVGPSKYCAVSCSFDAVPLTTTGTYKVVLDPGGAATGSVTAQVWNVPADPAYALTLGGAAVTATTTAGGQNATLSFPASAGQKVSVQATGGTFSSASLGIYKPDGTQLGTNSYCAQSCFTDVLTLPVAGTYKIFLDPAGTATGSISIRGWSVPADAPYTITLGGAAGTATTTVPGQGAAVSFAATAGQKVSVQLAGGTFNTATAYLYKPDGTQLDSEYCASSCFFDPLTLPVAGTYKVLVDPGGASTGSISVRGYSVPADTAYSMTLGGAAVTATVTVPGQNAAVSFTATAGQKVSVQLTGGAYNTASAVLHKPDGTQLDSNYCASSCFFDALTLPVAGTYKVLVDPDGGSTGSISVRGWSVPPDTAYTMTIGGAAVTATTTVPGQNTTVSFAGTASQKVTVQLTGGTFGVATARLYRPDGTQISSKSCSTSCTFTDTILATTGTYKVIVDPDRAAVGSISVKAVLVP